MKPKLIGGVVMVWVPIDLPDAEKARRFRALRFMLNAAARLCGVEIEIGSSQHGRWIEEVIERNPEA